MELHATINNNGMLEIVDNKNEMAEIDENTQLNNVNKLVLSLPRTVNGSVTDFSAIGNLTNLTSLEIKIDSDSSVTGLSAIGNLTNLTSLKIGGSTKSSVTDWSAIGNLTNLTSLSIGYLANLTDLSAIGELTNLTSLKIAWVAMSVTDLSAIGNLTNLTSLNISSLTSVTDLSAIGELTNLASLEIEGLRNATDLSTISNLTNLTSLSISSWPDATDLSTISNLTNLTSLSISSWPDLTDLSAIGNLTNLTSLSISYLSNLTDISPIGSLPNLTSLSIRRSDISPIGSLPNLTSLDIDTGDEINISAIGNLTNLTSLSIGKMCGVTDLSAIGNLTNLTSLSISSLSDVTDISAIGELINLTSLNISPDYDLAGVTDISAIGNLINLTSLEIRLFQGVTDISAIGNLINLTSLRIGGSGDLTDISAIGNLTNLTSLILWCLQRDDSCEVDISAIGNLTNLRDLRIVNDMYDIPDDHDISCIGNLTNLESLAIMFLSGMQDLSFIGELSNLKSLELQPCFAYDGESFELEFNAQEIGWIDWVSLGVSPGTIRADWTPEVECWEGWAWEEWDNAARHPNGLFNCKCGSTSFEGSYSGANYTSVEWSKRTSSIKVPFNSSGDSLIRLWGLLRAELSLNDYCPANTSIIMACNEFDIDHDSGNTDINLHCTECKDFFHINSRLLESPDDCQLPGEATERWREELMIADGVLGQKIMGTIGDGPTTVCPCCYGSIELFGESLWAEKEFGRAFGSVSFHDSTFFRARNNFDITGGDTNPGGGESLSQPAELGFRVGLKCADNQCFEYKGIDSEDAFLVPLIKVATYRATFLASNGQPYLDSYKSLLQGLAITADNAEHYLNRIKFCGDNFLLAAELEDDAQSLMKKTIKEMSFRD